MILLPLYSLVAFEAILSFAFPRFQKPYSTIDRHLFDVLQKILQISICPALHV